MDNNNSEEPDVKKRKSSAHDGSSTFKADGGSGDMASFDNGIATRFASYLCPRDLISLSLTCRRFGGTKNDNSLSLMEDTARQIICNAEEEERNALPKLTNQTYIELYSELLKHREPRVFDQLIGDKLCYVNNNRAHIKFAGETVAPNTAICDHVMQTGRHYCTFKGIKDSRHFWHIGITRPLPNWDKKGLTAFYLNDDRNYEEFQREGTERWGNSDINYCAVYVGELVPLAYEWGSWRGELVGMGNVCSEGGHSYKNGDKMGLLLDVDAGTLTVYKNGRVLGSIDGLSGEYCWFASTMFPGEELRIEKESIPV